jgi:hypothetical protein
MHISRRVCRAPECEDPVTCALLGMAFRLTPVTTLIPWRDLPGIPNQRISALTHRVLFGAADLFRYAHPGHLQLRVRVWIVEEALVG